VVAARTSATGVRGQYYGVAAAAGKVGAFVGTLVFPYIAAAGGGSAQGPFWVASGLCVVSAVVVMVGLPEIGQDMIAVEDARFREFLEGNGYDTGQLGVKEGGVGPDKPGSV
jgi:nitrate/nitrite transporter NarK